jgi:SAM-dependent methyltransferase
MNEQTHQWPEHAAAYNTHNRVLEIMQKHLPNLAGLSVLDIPCGAGAFSARLDTLGVNVVPMDIEAVEPFYSDRNKRVLADANQTLPFQDGAFDVLVTIEGIEHLENPSFYLRECARVIKPGGWIFLSTPNVDSFRSRKSVFIYGYHRYFGPRGDAQKDSWHLLPIDMIFLKGAAERARLEIVDVAVNDLSSRNIFKEILRGFMSRKLPQNMRGQIPFYGDVVIYALKKA